MSAYRENRFLNVVSIQKYCLEDGPGIRTTIYLKGCGLKCKWCQNPESISPNNVLLINPEDCVKCFSCARSCPYNAISVDSDGVVRVEEQSCAKCDGPAPCESTCPVGAIEKVGTKTSVEDIVKEVLREKVFYDASNSGGVTLSGGEPLLQTDSVVELLKALKTEGMHTTVETSGYLAWSKFEKVIPFVDLFYFDLKASKEAMPSLVGRPNASSVILSNAVKIASLPNVSVSFRMPVIPGYNDSPSIISTMSMFITGELNRKRITLLPYNKDGESKLNRMLNPEVEELKISASDAMESFRSVQAEFKKHGIEAVHQNSDEWREKAEEAHLVAKGRITPRIFSAMENLVHSTKSACVERAVIMTEFYRRSQYLPLMFSSLISCFLFILWCIRGAKMVILLPLLPFILFFSLVFAIFVPECFQRISDWKRDKVHKSMEIIKAKAMKNLMNKMSISIDPEFDIIVGNYTSKRLAGPIFPELHGLGFIFEIWGLNRRANNPLKISFREKVSLFLSLFPFWVFRAVPVQARGGIFSFGTIEFLVRQFGVNTSYATTNSAGMSHVIPDFAMLCAKGTRGIIRECETKLDQLRRASPSSEEDIVEKSNFYNASILVCDGFEGLASRYSILASKMADSISQDDDGNEVRKRRRIAELRRISDVCSRVPMYPATSLHEALQSILFIQIVVNLESLDNGVSLGRLDSTLQPYYEMDCKNDDKIFTAHDLVSSFCLRTSSIIPCFSDLGSNFYNGMMSGQGADIGGYNRDGSDATVEMTWIILDVIDAIRIRQPNWHAHIHSKTPPKLLKRICQCLCIGCNGPSLFNDDVIVPMFVDNGFDIADAREWGVCGCVEPSHPGMFGNTDAALVSLVAPLLITLGIPPPESVHLRYLRKLHPMGRRCERNFSKRLEDSRERILSAKSMEHVWNSFRINFEICMDELLADLRALEKANMKFHPTPVTSVFCRGCLESGRDVLAGGALFSSSGVQGVGVPDIANSMAAIECTVFQRAWGGGDRRFTMKNVLNAISSDFSSQRFQGLHQKLLTAPKFGNDLDSVDKYAKATMELFSSCLRKHSPLYARRRPEFEKYFVGYYSMTTYIELAKHCPALPSGRKSGRPFANGLTPPSDSTALNGPSAASLSIAKMPLRTAVNGINFNVSLQQDRSNSPSSLSALILGYFQAGGQQIQFNILDRQMLLDAYKDPDSFPDLLVRVSGYSAYFNDLSDEVKKEVIARCFTSAN